ncbi:MAG: hypothetical protein ACQETH_07570 [Candidatus Rifleibacteriota bacterium]
MVRWASFVLFALATLIIYGLVTSSHPDGISQAVLKNTLTSAAVYADFLPPYIWLIIYAGIFLLLLMGVPTILLFTPLFLTQGFVIAFFTVIIAQLNASIIATFLADKRNWSKNIPDKLKAKISNLKTPQPAFEFWARLYNAYPLRTIDLLSAARHGIHPLFKISVLTALVLRNLLPSIWVASLINLLVNYSPNPAQDSATFLLWSSILMVYIILPKIPELVICNKEVRIFLEQVETWNLENKTSNPEDKAKKQTNKADTQNLNLETQS